MSGLPRSLELPLGEGDDLGVHLRGPLLLNPVAALRQEHDSSELRYRRDHRIDLAEHYRGIQLDAHEECRLPHGAPAELRQRTSVLSALR